MTTPTTVNPNAGRSMRIAGIALIVAGVVLGALLVIAGISRIAGADPAPVEGTEVLTAAAGEAFALYRTGGPAEGGCSVTSADGSDVELEGIFGTETLTLDGTTYEVVRTFTAPAAGDLAVSCSSTGFAVGPRVGVFGAVGSILGGVFGGLALIAIGVVLLVIGVSRRKKSAQPPFGGGQPPFGQGQPPFGQGQPPFGQGQPPFGQGQPPFGGGQPPFGQGQPPFGQGQPPSGGGQPPFGQGQPPSGGGQPPPFGR